MDVSIIIVNYNTKQLLANCLKSIYEQTKDIEFEVIISDNGSTDGSIEMLKKDFPQVILIENNANLGFGAANNRGLTVAQGQYIFYLNSDTILLNNAVKIFFDYWEENGEKEKLGALGANLLNADGNIIHSYGDLENINDINHKISTLAHTVYGNSKLYLLNKLLKKPIPCTTSKKTFSEYKGAVGYITGADLFLKNDAAAYYDEHYFMYCEEMDLQYQMAEAGFLRIIIEGPKIIHLEGGSGKKENNLILQEALFSRINWRMSQIYFYKKHGAAAIKIRLWKILVLLLWLNPLVFKQTHKHIKKLWKI